MRPAGRGRLAGPLAAALALGAGGCGPYTELGQKLDVTTPIVDGETWVARNGTELRVLVLATPPPGGSAQFSLSAMEFPISAGTSAWAWQGTWTEAAGAATFTAGLEYLLPDERAASLWSRIGVTRSDVHKVATATLDRGTDTLTLTGDPAVAGAYVRWETALAQVGTTTARDAACAFQLANLGIRASEIRIIGFGGPTMTQYRNSAWFKGTLTGEFQVALSLRSDFSNTTTITFAGLSELSGSTVDGPQVTDASGSGNGHMSGTVRFTLATLAAGGAAGTPIAGTLDYGDANPADAVQIGDGFATGGHYLITLDGGGAALVAPETAPSPSVADCLALP